MDQPAMVVVVTIEPTGDVETGGWCDVCLLPSVTRVWFRVTWDGRPMGVGFHDTCTDHET